MHPVVITPLLAFFCLLYLLNKLDRIEENTRQNPPPPRQGTSQTKRKVDALLRHLNKI